MATELTPFAPAEDVALDLLTAAFPEIDDAGTSLDTVAAGQVSLRVRRIGGASTRLNAYPMLDIEIFAPTYAAAVSLSERISAYLLGYPRSVETGGRTVVIDMVEEIRPPVEQPWDDNVRRFASTYQFSVRR